MRTNTNPLYWELPTLLIANNSKVASTAIWKRISQRFGVAAETNEPTKPVYLLVRDPVERFQSAVATLLGMRLATDVDSTLAAMPDDVHLWHQSRYLAPVTHLYRYPDHLDQFAADTRLAPLPLLNQTREKPVLTEEQRERVLEIYRDDVELFTRAGVRHVISSKSQLLCEKFAPLPATSHRIYTIENPGLQAGVCD
jgi:hypothetical protein